MTTAALLAFEEREAVIAHELAHLRFFDGPLLIVTGFVAQLFSFVPGALRAFEALCAHVELAADAYAARSVAPSSLASALVCVAERAGTGAAPRGLAFTDGRANPSTEERLDFQRTRATFPSGPMIIVSFA